MRDPARLARFKNYNADPLHTVGLPADHLAVVEGRTLFPGTVVGTFNSRRFLVSVDNSSKIGKMIEKGPWAGFPTFTLTLEERATCPRSCHMWQGCFGNSMQWARRNDAYDPDFIPALKAEVITLVREVCSTLPNKPAYRPPKGIVIRLHVLGDFSSLDYVQAWADMMEKLPELHIFGYTANSVDDPERWEIAAAIQTLNRRFPDRWVIRFSNREPGAGHAIVVDEDPKLDDVVMCPASTHASECCSTCALCWNPNAWGKTIAFLRHGIKAKAGRGGRRETPEAREKVYDSLKARRGVHGILPNCSIRAMADDAGVPVSAAKRSLQRLVDERRVQILRAGDRAKAAVYRVFDEPQETFPLAPPLPAPAMKAAAPVRPARDPTVKPDAKPLRKRGPNDPLMSQRPHAHALGGWGKRQVGTADRFDIGTPEERIAALPEDEAARIAAQYGAVVKKETP